MPSGFMMNGPMWSFGAESTLKSGTSCPAHLPLDSFHHTCRRSGSQGFPAGSQDARLYMTRRVAGRGDCNVLPLQPARRVHERAVLLREAGARQAIDRRLNLLHLVGRRARRAPEFTGLVRIDLADDEPVRFLQRIDVLPGIRT